MNTTAILLLLTPVITAAIGWLTNWVAIQMLFHPRVPRNVFGWKWQGLIPRRQEQLADEASEIIEREILQQNMVATEIKKIDLNPFLQASAHKIVWDRIGPQLKIIPLLGGFINDTTLAKLELIAAKAMEDEAEQLVDKVGDQFEKQVDFRAIIRSKIASFDLEHLESIVNQVARREFRTIERLGAVLGFFIGCVQVLLFYLTGSIAV